MALTSRIMLREAPRSPAVAHAAFAQRPSQWAGRASNVSMQHVAAFRSSTIVHAAVSSTDNSMQSESRSPVDPLPTWQIRMLYDGDCPLCMKEVDFLRQRDEQTGNIDFVDISAPNYRAEDNAGISYEVAMGHIHGITRDGRIVKGVEVFQKLYEAVGLGWIYAITKWKPVYNVAEAVYSVWAKYRLPVTGRPSLEQVLESRQNEGLGCGDEDTACEIPLDKLYPNGPPSETTKQ